MMSHLHTMDESLIMGQLHSVPGLCRPISRLIGHNVGQTGFAQQSGPIHGPDTAQ